MKTKLLFLTLALLATGGSLFAQSNIGSSSSASSTGPVINVTAFGAASSNADNNTAFTAAVAALNSSTNPQINANGIGTPITATPIQTGSTTSDVVTISFPAGSTVIVGVADGVSPHTFTITDTGGSVYAQQGLPKSSAGAGSLQLYSTAPGGSKAATSVTITNGGAAEPKSIFVIAYPSVVAIVNPTTATANTTTTVSNSFTSTRSVSSVFMACEWFNSNISSFTATAGTARETIASDAVNHAGLVAMDNSSGPIGSITNSGTFSLSTNWNCNSLELQSVGASVQQPTLYIPAGYYSYSGGLAPAIPSTIKCEPGAILYYTGSTHALDIGPTGLTRATAQWPYFIDGCQFQGASNATEGININAFILYVGIRNSTFVNFGAPSSGITSSWMIAGQGDNWDVEVGPQDRFETTDYIPRNVLRLNLLGSDSFSFLRFHDNNMYCTLGPSANGGGGGGCSASQAGIGIFADGSQNLIFGNSLAFFNPDVWLACTNAPCYGDRMEHNLVNSVTNTIAGGTAVPALQYQGQQQALDIHDNNFDINVGTTSAIGPRDGAATIQSSRFNFNQANIISNATAFLAMNNLAGQTNNQSSNNMCNTVQNSGTYSPCPVPHTKGSNISAFNFNNDDGHQASGYFVTGTTFTASGCANSTLVGGATAGTYTSVTAGSCTVTLTMGDALTAAHGWACDAHDLTTVADANNITMGTSTTTTANLVEGTVVANDVIAFKCIGY